MTFAGELTTTLIADGGLEVVERRELDRVLSELSSYSAGVFDTTTTAELQKLLGIDALITGSIANLGGRVKINARGIGVETAQSYAAGSVSVVKDDTISYLLNQASSSATGEVNVQPSDVFFRNQLLHIVPTVVTIDGQTLRVVAEFRNVSGEELLIGHDSRESRAVSDTGENLGTARVDGINRISTGNPSARKPDSYTRLETGSSKTVIWEHKSTYAIGGSTFTAALEIVEWHSSGFETFTAELRNLQP